MAEPVQHLEKWLIEKPSERVTIVSREHRPAKRVEQLLNAVDVESIVIDSKEKLSDMSAYVLTIPPLCERLEDLPLITEFIIAEHLDIYSGVFPGVHPSYLPVFYYLCNRYDSPNGLTTPLLTEDNYVGFLRKAISEKILDRTVFERVQFKCQLNSYEETKSGLCPFTLLEDEFIVLPLNSTFENSRRGWTFGETDTEISTLSDPRTGRTMGFCAHLRSISSEEFGTFLENSDLSKKNKGEQELVNLESLQLSMIRCGSKCIAQLAKLKPKPISVIFNKQKRALDSLSQMISSTTIVPFSDDGKFKIFEDDSSVTYKGSKYCLPIRYFLAIKHLAEQKKKSNLTLHKRSVYEYCYGDYLSKVPEYVRAKSVRKWFYDNGGEAKRFVQDGLLKSVSVSECEIPVSPDLIEIVPI